MPIIVAILAFVAIILLFPFLIFLLAPPVCAWLGIAAPSYGVCLCGWVIAGLCFRSK